MTAPHEQTSGQDEAQPNLREVRYEVTRDFAGILNEQGISLLVSTYQAGKLVAIGVNGDALSLSFHNFEQAMGVACHERQIAVGGRNQIWLLHSAPAIVARLEGQQHDACYLARSSHVTDEIHGHELAWVDDELWLVNTRFSCLCTLHPPYSFVPRWWPPFISSLAPEDRCHLNGLAVVNGRPKYVTAMSETDSLSGWRAVKATDGCLIDVPSGETVAQGFAMPHSPRVYDGRLFVLDSGRGQIDVVDPATGRFQPISQQPGYTRGLAFAGPYAFVGLSKIRETSTFGGVPIAERREGLKCAVAVIDLRTCRRVAHFEFLSGVEEVFDVQVLRGVRNPFISGPLAVAEGHKSMMYAPRPGMLPAEAEHSASTGKVSPRARPNVNETALALYRRGNVLSDEDRFVEATQCFEQAVGQCPDFAEAHCNLGVVLQFQRRLNESLASFQRALEIDPDLPAAHFNMAMTYFLQEDFAHAWPEYEWRWRCARFGNRPAAAIRLAPVWDGTSLAGRTILVYGEQGIGDEMMFASCLPDVMDRAKRCVVACEMRLVPLFARSFPKAEVIAVHELESLSRADELGRLDCQVACATVPSFVRPDAASFPPGDGFLIADEERAARWRERFDQIGVGRKVGISWRGGKEPVEMRRRSTTLGQWSGVLSVPGVHFVNLQYGERAKDIEAARDQFGVEIHDWPDVDPLSNMDDFAAQIAALDLVISIDNSTVHLAGSLGVPTWMLASFPSASCWRWPLERTDNRWYRSLRIFRREWPQDWRGVFDRVRQTLAGNTASH